ncbi:hypothetical protein [Oceanibacterium hippocampi]|uniref:Apolipoprotein A1/A4/E domain protein n=1 Tax=Oceanibacterium hippocampi TaxID=745714 RepID=A0A1Y5TUN5_9PROT|nr:hypothetical protein [Oceanibacterium hippocampi]SLN70149.1 hypothetical protein OCH7691_03252 [Oceanibacterium hippocampi]
MTRIPLLASVIVAASLLFAAVPPAHADEASKLAAETEEAWNAFKNYSAAQRDEAKEAGQNLLDSVDRQLEAANRKIGESTGAAKEAWENRQENLARLRAETERKLDALNEESGETWEKMKEGFSSTYDRLRKAVKEAVDETET